MDTSTQQLVTTEHLEAQHQINNRFIIELVIIGLSVLSNGIGLYAAIKTHKTNKSVYHILYVNVSLSNIIACLITWFCGNLPFFFNDWFKENLVEGMEMYCQAQAYKQNALLVALSVSIQMNVAMLSLAVCQYFAICRPLTSMYVMQKKRAYVLIGGGILAFLLCALIPFGAMLALVRQTECDQTLIDKLITIVTSSANLYAAIVTLLYVMMIAFGLRIYVELRSFTKKTRQNSRRKSVNINEKKLNYDKRAYTATVFLLLSRTLFTIPLMIYFVININASGFSPNVYIHYFTMVPCAKCIFDPLIYGSIMRDVRKTWRKVCACCYRGDGDESRTLTGSSLRSDCSTSSRGTSVYDRDRFNNSLSVDPNTQESQEKNRF